MALVGKQKVRTLEQTALTQPDTTGIRLAAIADSTDDAIITKDLDGTITSWNAAATRIFGYSAQDIIGESILTLIPPELHQEEDEILRRLRAGEQIRHHETIRLRRDGTRLNVLLTILPLVNDEGIVIGASKIARDITEEKRAERARFHLAAIVDSSDDAIASKDLNGIITSWNHAAERIFGWTSDEIVGRSVLLLIPSHLQHEEEELLRRLRAGQRVDHYETQRVRKDGTIIDVSLSVSPIKDPTGRVIGASKIARDITEQKRMHRALIESEKLAATGRMAAAIAHEINNPLEAVTNLAYLLSLDDSLNKSAREYATTMLQEVSRASEITRQTLAFYRDTSRPTLVDLPTLLDNVLTLNRPKILKKDIVIVRDFKTSSEVTGYAGEIRQVFANLVLNAIDAVPLGGCIRIRINDAVEHNDEMVRVSIADNGPGIPLENRSRLFVPFFTTKGNAGNGLGLWVSRGIIEKHCGKIVVRSRTQKGLSGSVFSVLLKK